MGDTQISAYISDTTKREVERYADAHGVKKGRLVEEALLHHLQALRALPADVVIPPRLALTRASLANVVGLVRRPKRATKSLRDLLAGRRVDGAP